MAASSTANEVVWLSSLLESMALLQQGPTFLYEDNQACIMISEHPSSYKGRARHIDMRVHSLKDHVAQATVKLVSCPKYDMTADCLTKALPAPAFKCHRSMHMGNIQHTAPAVPAFFAAQIVLHNARAHI